jgi:F-type H+-transporting ATPase subunit gamma
MNNGKIIQILGPVVDVRFEDADLPRLKDALEAGGFRTEGRRQAREMVYLPSPEDVFTKSVPNYLTGVLYGAMVESYAAEQNARMQAMDSATENAQEMLQDLSLLYNRVRQAAITQEITEVVGGAQARER